MKLNRAELMVGTGRIGRDWAVLGGIVRDWGLSRWHHKLRSAAWPFP